MLDAYLSPNEDRVDSVCRIVLGRTVLVLDILVKTDGVNVCLDSGKISSGGTGRIRHLGIRTVSLKLWIMRVRADGHAKSKLFS